MTLKEKFENIEFAFPASESVKIADDYAIEFQKWVDINYFKHNTFTETTSTEEMLKIFKKEKGL